MDERGVILEMMKVSPKWVKSLHLSEPDDFDFKNTIDNSEREFSLKLETKNH